MSYLIPSLFGTPNSTANSSIGVSTTSIDPTASLNANVKNLGQKVIASITNPTVRLLSESGKAVSLLKYTSEASAFAAITMFITGLTTSMIGLTILGVLFTLSSIVGVYYADKLGYLKDIDQYEEELAALNASIGQKNEEIKQLNAEINQTAQEFALLQVKFANLIKDNNVSQNSLLAQLNETQTKLQQATDNFSKVQNKVASDFEQKLNAYKNEEKNFQRDIDLDQAQIVNIQKTNDKASQEIVELKVQLAALEGTVEKYKTQNSEFARQNDRLQEQIKLMANASKVPSIDVNSINQHAQDLQALLVNHNSQAAKVSANADQLNAMLDSISAQAKKNTNK